MRFRLRSLLIVILLLGLALAPFAARMRYASIQRRNREILHGHGWTARYEWNTEPGMNALMPLDRWRPPEWAEQLLGSDFFYDVTWVRQATPDESEEAGDIELVAAFHGLRRLELNMGADDSYLAAIAHLRNIEWLQLSETKITDAGLKHIAGYRNLTFLELTDTQVTDEGLIHLAKFSELRSLQLDGTAITGRGFRHLHTLSHLESLCASDTRLDDEGLAQLAPLTSLRSLAIYYTAVSDSSIPLLKSFPHLSFLGIKETQITAEAQQAIDEHLNERWERERQLYLKNQADA